ncbi:MAG: hypothetical protein ABSF91_12855 [Bacteroidota bacterium]|jgi:hypothetical protein
MSIRVNRSASNTKSLSILKLEIPILFSRIFESRIAILIDRARLPYFLDLQQSDLDALTKDHLITEPVEEKMPPKRINYQQLALQYTQMLDNEQFPSRSAMARELGVSHAWISMVMNRTVRTSHS